MRETLCNQHLSIYLASFTIMLLPSILDSCSALTAWYACEEFSISTNPKHLDLFEVRFITTFADNTVPCFSNVCFNFLLSNDRGSDPTNNFELTKNL